MMDVLAIIFVVGWCAWCWLFWLWVSEVSR